MSAVPLLGVFTGLAPSLRLCLFLRAPRLTSFVTRSLMGESCALLPLDELSDGATSGSLGNEARLGGGATDPMNLSGTHTRPCEHAEHVGDD